MEDASVDCVKGIRIGHDGEVERPVNGIVTIPPSEDSCKGTVTGVALIEGENARIDAVVDENGIAVLTVPPKPDTGCKGTVTGVSIRGCDDTIIDAEIDENGMAVLTIEELGFDELSVEKLYVKGRDAE